MNLPLREVKAMIRACIASLPDVTVYGILGDRVSYLEQFDADAFYGGEPELHAFSSVFDRCTTAFVRAATDVGTLQEKVFVNCMTYSKMAKRSVFVINTGQHYEPMCTELLASDGVSGYVQTFSFETGTPGLLHTMQLVAQIHLFPWIGGVTRRSLPWSPSPAVLPKAVKPHAAVTSPLHPPKAADPTSTHRPAVTNGSSTDGDGFEESSQERRKKKRVNAKAKAKQTATHSSAPPTLTQGGDSRVTRPFVCCVRVKGYGGYTVSVVRDWLHARAGGSIKSLVSLLPVYPKSNRSESHRVTIFYAVFSNARDPQALIKRGSLPSGAGGGPHISIYAYAQRNDWNGLVASSLSTSSSLSTAAAHSDRRPDPAPSRVSHQAPASSETWAGKVGSKLVPANGPLLATAANAVAAESSPVIDHDQRIRALEVALSRALQHSPTALPTAPVPPLSIIAPPPAPSLSAPIANQQHLSAEVLAAIHTAVLQADRMRYSTQPPAPLRALPPPPMPSSLPQWDDALGVWVLRPAK